MLPSTNFVEIILPKSFRDNFAAVEYISSLIMFLITINIEVVQFSDIVNKPFVKTILIPSQASSFWDATNTFLRLL